MKFIKKKPWWHSDAALPQHYYFNCLNSTQTEARHRVIAGLLPPEGLLIRADYQTAGYGQRGRQWVSLPGNALGTYAFLWPKPFIDPKLSISIAGLLCQFIERLGVSARIKEPNDVLVKDAKIAGMLIEGVKNTDNILTALIGIGLNLHHSPSHAYSLSYPTTNLAQQGVFIRPAAFFKAFSTGLLTVMRQIYNEAY